MCIESLFHWKAPLIVNDPMNTSSIPLTMNQFMYRSTIHVSRLEGHYAGPYSTPTLRTGTR